MSRAPIKKLPSLKKLLALFGYDPNTGVLRWKPRKPTTKYNLGFNKKLAGRPAGTRFSGRSGNRYIAVGLARGDYHKAHRIIWKIMTGKEPPAFIDHADGNNFNNRWANLREASNSKNLQNAKLRRDNRSGVKGVSWDAGHKKWKAVISINKKYIRLGRFSTVAEAAAVIETERLKLHGKFGRLK